jgi:outer membrane protein OmpA-like peptidoglycan-associated protein
MTLDSSAIKSTANDETDSSHWLTISDLMSGLAMLFALLFVVVQISLHEKTKQLQKYEKALKDLPLVILAAIQRDIGGGKARVDLKTGDVVIDDAFLFGEGSDKLSPAGEDFLKKFLPSYSKVILSSPDFENLVRYIVLDGRTSSKGSDGANRELSLKRYLSVSNFIFSGAISFTGKERIVKKILMAGRGEVDARQERDDANDRKVVIRFEAERPNLSGLLPPNIVNSK